MISTVSLIFISSLAANSSAIGIVTAEGSLRLAGSVVTGSGSLTEGASVDTEEASARLLLKSGARVEVGTHSSVRIFAQRLVLQSGTARVNGPLEVANKEGMLLARVIPGPALDFALTANSSAISEVTGAIVTRNGKYFLQDELSRLTFELSTSGDPLKLLKKSVGQRVSVQGSLAKGGDVLRVSSISSVTSQENTITYPKIAKSAMGSGVSTKAIVAGVAIAAGAATGLAITTSSSGSTSTLSQ